MRREQKFIGAIRARPELQRSDGAARRACPSSRATCAQATKVVDKYLNAFRPAPDVLYAAVGVARASSDRMGEEKYTRTLRLEFPESEQARALKRNN